MRHTAAEKYAIIRLVEGSDLPVRHTLRELQVHRSTFYAWYHRYAAHGQAGQAPTPAAARRYWNRMPLHHRVGGAEVDADGGRHRDARPGPGYDRRGPHPGRASPPAPQ